MSARILDGKALAQTLINQVRERVQHKREMGLRPPGLAVIMVGNNPASQVYVRNKRRAAEKVGIEAHDYDLPAGTTEAELLDLIDQLNADPKINGILIQLPLPGIPDARRLIQRIDPRKDVDGFHPQNVGLLAQGRATLAACTPSGVIALLDRCDIPIAGLRAVVIGRSVSSTSRSHARFTSSSAGSSQMT